MTEFLTQDKRQDLRLQETLPVRLRFLDGKEEFLDASTTDISLGGAQIKIEIEKKILGKKVLVEIISSPVGSVILTSAQVVWHREEKGRILAVGLKFVDVDETRKEEILKLVLEKLFPPRETRITFGPISRRLTEKESRSLEILDLIRREGPVSISSISKAIEVNVVTTTNYLKDYLKKELIIECGADVSSGGRRPNLMALNSKFGFVIGLEINRPENFILGMMVDLASKITTRIKEDLPADANINQKSVSLILRLIKDGKVDIQKILGVGVGLDSLTNVEPLKEYVEKKTGLSVLCQHSSQVGAFAEKWLNMDLAGMDNLVYLDSPQHCSLMIDGKLYLGASEEAGWIRQPRSLIEEDLFCLTSLLNPQVMIISRRLVEQAGDVLRVIREDMRRALPALTRLPTVIAATLGEDTVAQAVCALAIREIFMQI
jgi:DNA-binding Lrp family transcriptional regulator